MIAKFELARHLRSRHTIVAAVLLVAFCGLSSYQLAEYADRLAAVGRELGPALDMIAGMVEGVTELPAVAIRGLLRERPPVLVALFALVLALMPLLTTILAYNQTATDIETRHIRYLLFRSDRVSIYVGKSLGAWMLVAGAIGLVLVLFGVFLGLRSNSLEGMRGVIYLVRIWLTAACYAVPLIVLLGLISALVGRARRSLSLTLLFWFGVTVASGLLGLADERLEILAYLFPTTGRFGLLLDGLGDKFGMILYLLVYTAIVGGLGLWRFRSRDL